MYVPFEKIPSCDDRVFGKKLSWLDVKKNHDQVNTQIQVYLYYWMIKTWLVISFKIAIRYQ